MAAQIEKVANGLEAAQAWLADAWDGFKSGGRADLADRAYRIIVELDQLAGDAQKFPGAGTPLLRSR